MFHSRIKLCFADNVVLSTKAEKSTLLDKVRCAIIGEFQMDQHHGMFKDDHTRPYMVTKEGVCVCLEQNISIGSNCME